jgi:hypothetical protein
MSGAASIALMSAGAANNAVGAYYSAKGQRTSLRYQADIAETNARLSEMGAQSELARGQREEQSVRLRTAQLKSGQRAAMAANGIDLGEGSAAEILTSTDYMGEMDANTVASNAVQSAWGQRTQSLNFKNDALMARATASGINPSAAAMTSLLGDAGKIAAQWSSMNKSGAKPSTSKSFGPKLDSFYFSGNRGSGD